MTTTTPYRLRARVELALFLAAYLIYDLGRWVAAGEEAPAIAHAGWVLDVERRFGVSVERTVQDALDTGVVMTLLSNVYLAAQLAVVPGALLWLYRRAPAIYPRLRNTVLATWLLAIPIYAAFPVAPPRLAGIGMSDSVSGQAAVALTGHSTMFYNPLAAVPSLHCGFALAVSVALAAAARRRVTRALALLWCPTVCLAVVATGNHYLFDIAAGLLVTVAGYVLGSLPARLRGARRPVLVQEPAWGCSPC
jgi:membrane-associated phospholipid phosphatase